MNTGAAKPARNKFWFSEYLLMPRPTGKKAANLRELLQHLREMSEPVLRYHLLESRLATLPPILEYPNDFALWAANSLHDDELAEKLSGIDPFEFENLAQVREALVDLLEAYLRDHRPRPPVLPGFELYLCEGSAVVMPSGIGAQTLPQFCRALQTVALDSVYYHFVEARWRLGDRKRDDFSHWIDNNFSLPDLVRDIRAIDVYFYTPTEIRETLVSLIKQHAGDICG